MDYMEAEEVINLDLNGEFLVLFARESSASWGKDTFQKKFSSKFSSS